MTKKRIPTAKKTKKTNLEKFRSKEKEGYKRIPAPQPRSK
jgi:hypothetical protein